MLGLWHGIPERVGIWGDKNAGKHSVVAAEFFRHVLGIELVQRLVCRFL